MKIILVLPATILLATLLVILESVSHSPPSHLNPETGIVKAPSTIPSPSPFFPEELTLDWLFNPDRHRLENLEPHRIRTIIATGDVVPGRSVNYKMNLYHNFSWPFSKIASFLNQADITYINLEAPLIENCPITVEGMTFCGDARTIEGLVLAGVDIANLANNHSGNYGSAGLDRTVAILEQNQVRSCGRGKPSFTDIRGMKFAFLGYNWIKDGENNLAWADRMQVTDQIRQAKTKADIVVVGFHWGIEYTSQPTREQREMAHVAVDAGADLVLGNHPHWIQPLEIYQNKLVVYAHGNFVFDQMWSEKTKEGIVGKYTFYDAKLVDAEFFPIKIADYGQPYFLEGEEKSTILEGLRQESIALQNSSL